MLCNQDNNDKSESENPNEPSSSLEKLISCVITDAQFVPELVVLVEGLDVDSFVDVPVAFA